MNIINPEDYNLNLPNEINEDKYTNSIDMISNKISRVIGRTLLITGLYSGVFVIDSSNNYETVYADYECLPGELADYIKAIVSPEGVISLIDMCYGAPSTTKPPAPSTTKPPAPSTTKPPAPSTTKPPAQSTTMTEERELVSIKVNDVHGRIGFMALRASTKGSIEYVQINQFTYFENILVSSKKN